MDEKELARLDCSSHIVSSHYTNPTNISLHWISAGHDMDIWTWTQNGQLRMAVTALQYSGQTHWTLVFQLAHDNGHTEADTTW